MNALADAAVVAVYLAVVVGFVAFVVQMYRLAASQRPTPPEPEPGAGGFTAADAEFIADISARMKTYGAAAADYYDTSGD
ncbi:hypothetical protein [Streptomyces sp. NPDC088736]|uniref:hypothetical protein n=1 Tax=Streptomyces sp. NPDC088736 TaxID=3365881 RepID=UPI0037F9CC93